MVTGEKYLVLSPRTGEFVCYNTTSWRHELSTTPPRPLSLVQAMRRGECYLEEHPEVSSDELVLVAAAR